MRILLVMLAAGAILTWLLSAFLVSSPPPKPIVVNVLTCEQQQELVGDVKSMLLSSEVYGHFEEAKMWRKVLEEEQDKACR